MLMEGHEIEWDGQSGTQRGDVSKDYKKVEK